MMKIPKWLRIEVDEYDMDLPFTPLVILDIGANIGAFTAKMLQKYPDALIHAYEPVPENCADFLKNIKSCRVNLIQSAVRGFDGIQNMNISTIFTAHSFHRWDNCMTGERLKVSCMDAINLPKADLVKLDVEGCELEIIKRMKLNGVKALVVEYHSLFLKQEIQKIMLVNGFKLISPETSEKIGVLKFII